MERGKSQRVLLIMAAAVILIMADYPLGTEGKTVLLGRLCFSLGILLIGGLILGSFISETVKKKKMYAGLLVAALTGAVILLIGAWVFIGVGRDMVSGPKTVVLSSCEITEVQGAFGILAYRHYYRRN